MISETRKILLSAGAAAALAFAAQAAQAHEPHACVDDACQTEVLFEEWAALRKKGIKTPQIAVWHAVPSGSTQYTGYQKIYQDPADEGLVLRDAKSKK